MRLPRANATIFTSYLYHSVSAGPREQVLPTLTVAQSRALVRSQTTAWIAEDLAR